jgi:hypothetical protein
MGCRIAIIVFVLTVAASACVQRAVAQDTPEAPPAAPAASVAAAATSDKPLPTAEEIVGKYEDATGGRDAKARFTTRAVKGIYQTKDASGFAGIEEFSKTPNKRYFKISFTNGITIREVCDGKAAWIEDPVGGVHAYTGVALESRLRAASFSNGAGLLDLKMPGQVVGIVQVGPHSTYEVQFSPDKKYTLYVYFDTTSGLAVRADDVFRKDGGDFTVQTLMDDYRAVDGLIVPFRFRHVEKGNIFTIRVTQIKNNPPVDDSLFVRPATAVNEQ